MHSKSPPIWWYTQVTARRETKKGVSSTRTNQSPWFCLFYLHLNIATCSTQWDLQDTQISGKTSYKWPSTSVASAKHHTGHSLVTASTVSGSIIYRTNMQHMVLHYVYKHYGTCCDATWQRWCIQASSIGCGPVWVRHTAEVFCHIWWHTAARNDEGLKQRHMQ